MMFRKIGRLGHLLTFEFNSWQILYKTVSVPVSLVTLRMGNRSVLISTTDNAWRSDYDTAEEANKVYHEFLACMLSPNFYTQSGTMDSISNQLDFSAMLKVADVSKDLPKLQ
jgi:hypothetical protein